MYKRTGLSYKPSYIKANYALREKSKKTNLNKGVIMNINSTIINKINSIENIKFYDILYLILE